MMVRQGGDDESIQGALQEGKSLSFTAAEALMLLDILKNEEEKLKLLAEQASPLPFRIRV